MEILYNKAEAEQLLASLGVLTVMLRFKRRQVDSRVSIEPRNFVKFRRFTMSMVWKTICCITIIARYAIRLRGQRPNHAIQ